MSIFKDVKEDAVQNEELNAKDDLFTVVSEEEQDYRPGIYSVGNCGLASLPYGGLRYRSADGNQSGPDSGGCSRGLKDRRVW